MKKSLLLLSIPALFLAASCSTDELVDAPESKDKAITFAPNLQNCSRGYTDNPVWHDAATFKEFFAYAFSNDPGHDTDNFFSDHTVVKNQDGTWGPQGDTHYYFPEWRLKFVAYAPGGVYELGGMTGVGQGTRYRFYTDFTPQKQMIKNIDLAFYNKVDLIVAANGKRNLRNDPKVKMTFKHALSKVTINVKQTNPALRFEVFNAGIGNAPDRGTFTFPDCTDKEEIEVTQDCWSFPYDSRSDFSPKEPNSHTVDGNGRLANIGDFLIFPHNTTTGGYWTGGPEEDGDYLYVTCRILQKSGPDSFETVLNQTASSSSIAIPLKFDFQPGYHYTFNVDVTNGGLIPPAEKQTDGGTPVLNGAISYSVTSNHWEVADKNLNM